MRKIWGAACSELRKIYKAERAFDLSNQLIAVLPCTRACALSILQDHSSYSSLRDLQVVRVAQAQRITLMNTYMIIPTT